MSDIPVWRYDPEPECEHIATVTAPWTVLCDDEVVGTTEPITSCVTCDAIINDPNPLQLSRFTTARPEGA